MFYQSTGCSRLGGKNESYNEKLQSALVGVAKWLERQPAHRRVTAGLDSLSRAHTWVSGSIPIVGGKQSMSLSLSPAFHSKKVHGKIPLIED